MGNELMAGSVGSLPASVQFHAWASSNVMMALSLAGLALRCRLAGNTISTSLRHGRLELILRVILNLSTGKRVAPRSTG